jgi:hypothetical protein
VISTYFTVVCKVSVQIIQEIAPRIKSVVIVPCEPARIAFITYNGDVPISPKTIPMVIMMPAMEKA